MRSIVLKSRSELSKRACSLPFREHRPEPYWQAHTNPDSIPQSLKDNLTVWATRGPISSDFECAAELFPAVSYQYVLYGMGFKPDFSVHRHLYQDKEKASRIILQNQQLTQQMLPTLPTHREYIEKWLASNQF